MSDTATKNVPDYLREARLKAGYASRGTATTKVPYSQETIGRHERGEVLMEPGDAVLYSESYKNPAILVKYCAGCPVGQRIGRKATDRPLPLATLRVSRMLEDAQEVADQLEEIAFDGVIDDSEREDFGNALAFLRKLEETISDILLVGMNAGIEKAAKQANITQIHYVDTTVSKVYIPLLFIPIYAKTTRTTVYGE